jgi:hypothetical protein
VAGKAEYQLKFFRQTNIVIRNRRILSGTESLGDRNGLIPCIIVESKSWEKQGKGLKDE